MPDKDTKKNQILRFFKTNPGASIGSMAQAVGIDRAYANAYAQRLKKEEFLVNTGYGRYRTMEKAEQHLSEQPLLEYLGRSDNSIQSTPSVDTSWDGAYKLQHEIQALRIKYGKARFEEAFRMIKKIEGGQ